MTSTNKVTNSANEWRQLLAGLTLLSRGQYAETSPLTCVYDRLTVMSDPAEFTEAEIAQLEEWGFHIDDTVFYSFRFGSA